VPELPEIRALSERIEAHFSGATLVGTDALSFSALRTVTPPPDALKGKKLAGVGHRGKFLMFDFSPLWVLVHLSQGGRVVFETKKVTPRPRGGVLRLRFDRDGPLLVHEFGTERKAGWWILEGADPGPLARLGPEPDSPQFEQLLLEGQDGGRIHSLLRDQRRVAGIGRGYSDDILHRAKLSPFRSLSSLSLEERGRLVAAVRSVLSEALETERQRQGGLPPKLGDHFTVHRKAGTPCPVCGDDLRRVSYQSHEVTYCPTCQTAGKVLADRRLSRLVR
jgi:formamidopyrimidine-DNA glycosylase